MARSYSSYVDHFSPQDQSLDAPSDGQTYGRQDGSWVPVSSGGGGGGGDAVQKTGDTMTGTLTVASPDNTQGLAVTDPWGDTTQIGPYSIAVTNTSNYPSSIALIDHAGTSIRLDTNGITVRGDKFDVNVTPTPTPAFLIENVAGTDAIGLAVGEFGDGIGVFKANGQPAHLRMANGSVVSMWYAGGRLTMGSSGIDFNDNAGFHVRVYADGTTTEDLIVQTSANYGITFASSQIGGVRGRLYFDATTGDLMVAQSVGPHAGQSMNLTNGFAAVK
jgi:hypothetical protein